MFGGTCSLLKRSRCGHPVAAGYRSRALGSSHVSQTSALRSVGLDNSEQMGTLTEGLMRRGFSPENTRKVLGENWLRVFQHVWGA
ncbi:membrane dipeptidase [Bradyrhizobium sp. B120]|uniref:membrane dipeptidase n=1 Tax=Bradyrhizobium sp. B120 TaxID=3410088 RepID=UPI003B984D5B